MQIASIDWLIYSDILWFAAHIDKYRRFAKVLRVKIVYSLW